MASRAEFDGLPDRLASSPLCRADAARRRTPAAIQIDRPRYVEVVGDGVELVKFVHAVGHRIGEGIFLGVDACRP